MVPTDSSRGQIDVGWECETVFTNQLIPTRIVKAVQRKQALDIQRLSLLDVVGACRAILA